MRSYNLQDNQIVTILDNGKLLFTSYGTQIAEISKTGVVTLDAKYWDCSRTTLKWLKVFLEINLSKKEIQEKIDNKIYKTKNLKGS